MATCKTIVLAQPEGGTSVNYEIPTDETAQLTFGPEQISGLKLNEFGGLEITFLDGSTVNLTNFEELAANGNLLYLNDGTLVDPTLVSGALSGTSTSGDDSSGILTIVAPAENVTREITLEPGQKYVLDFDFANPTGAEMQDGDLVISFANDGTLVLNNFDEATAGELPAELSLTSEDNIIAPEELLTSLELQETVPEETELAAFEDAEPKSEVRETEIADVQTEELQQVAQIEPAAGEEIFQAPQGTGEDLDAIAEALQEVEPAAGEAGGAGGRGGYGFNSTSGSEPLGSIDDIGPINPTQLNYQRPEFNDEPLDLNTQGTPNGQPIMVSPPFENLDESNLENGPLVETGALNIDFGSDGPGSVGPNGSFTPGGSLDNGVLSYNGTPISVTPTADGYVGVAGGITVFTLVIDPQTGEYTYTQFEPFDHGDPANDNDVISLEFGVVATDSDGDAAETVITVLVADDAPEIEGAEETIDETDLGPVVETGTLDVDFGEDGQGSVTPTGMATFTGSVLGGTLTSNGVPVDITPTTNGYVGTANGVNIFTLEVDPSTGDYTFTLNGPLDHADPSNPNDVITLTFGVEIEDFDGDTDTADIVINILDDTPSFPENNNPYLGGPVDVIDETDLDGGDLVVSGNIPLDYGQDGPGMAMITGVFEFGGSLAGGTLTSGGDPVEVTSNGNIYTGVAGGVTVFTLEFDPATGDYEFTLYQPLDHADPNDPNDIIDLEFGIKMSDADGDTAQTTITIKVKDDVPSVGDSFGDVDESNLEDGPITFSDTVDATFGIEVGSVLPNGDIIATVGGTPIALTSGGETVVFEQTPDGYKGTINGGADTVFELTVDPDTGKYTYTQYAPFDHPDGTDPNDTIELTFGVEVISQDGDSDDGSIVISVADDGPVANDDVTGAEEGQVITGDLTANDDESSDVENTVTSIEYDGTTYPVAVGTPTEIDTPLGKLTVNSDGTYTFEAVDGTDPDGALEFTYTLTDSDGDSDPAKLSIRVTPDGQPIAVTEMMTVDETNLTPGPLVINETLDVDFGLDGAGTIDPSGNTNVSGSVAGGALTSGGEPVEIVATADGYQGIISGTDTVVFELIVQDNGDYSFELFQTLDHANLTDPNDLIRLDFGVNISDADGDTVEGTITINVLDDAPVAYDDSIALEEGGTATGNVVDNDIEGEDAPSTVTNVRFNGVDYPVVEGTPTEVQGTFGKLTINSDGSYTYVVTDTNDPNGTDSFTYTLTDFDGDSDTAELDVRVTPDFDPVVNPDTKALDETNLDNGDIVVNGQISIDFGEDGPGSLTPNGDFTPGGSLDNGALTSNGQPVSVTPTDNGYEGKLPDGTIVFTLDVDPESGAYEFTLEEPLDHADGNNPDDVISLEFGVVATDADGDETPTTITINVADDAPGDVDPVEETIDETDLKDGPIQTSGSLDEDFGSDGPGAVSPNGDFTPGGSLDNGALTSGGKSVTVTPTDDGYVGKLPDGTVVFELTVDPIDGDYEFTQFQPLDHADDNDPNDVISLQFGVDVTDFDGDTVDTTITINIKDDAPVFQPEGPSPDNGIETVDETDLGPVVETGQLNANFGSDAPGSYGFIPNHTVNGSVAGGGLTSNGVPVVIALVAGEFVGTANGAEIFKLTLDETSGEYEFTLTGVLDHADGNNPNDVITIEFGVYAADSEGESVNGEIVINIKDDAPIAHDDFNMFDTTSGLADGNVISGLNGGAGAADDLSNDADNTVVKIAFGANEVEVPETGSVSIDGDFGTLTIESDGSYTYELFDQYKGNLSGTSSVSLDPSASDVAGVQGSITKNGITVTGSNPDLVWETNTGAGIGLQDGSGSNNVFGADEFLSLTFDENPQSVEITLADIGSNNVGATFTYDVYLASDPTTPIQQSVTLDDVSGGLSSFTVDLGEEIAEIVLTGDGPSFRLNDVTANYDGIDCTEDQFVYTLQDGDDDTSTAILDLKGKDLTDNTPVIAEPITEIVDETDLGPVVETGTVTAHFFGEGPGKIEGSDTFSFMGSAKTQDGQLLSGGVKVDVTFEDGVYTGKAGNETVFTLSLEQDGDYTFTLLGTLDHADESNPDDAIDLKFGVTATDADGDFDTANITVTVKDDGPSITTKFHPVDEGDITDTTPLTYSSTLPHDFGADGAGEINPTGTFMAMHDSNGPLVTLTSQGKDIAVTETAGGYVGTASDGRTIFTLDVQDNGQFTYTQFDQIDHPNGNNPDDVIWLKFEVEITDADGDTDTAMIGIDVHDDGPVAHDDSGDVTETEGTTTGNLLFNDDIGTDAPGNVTKIGNTVLGNDGTATIQGTYGTLTVLADGSYTYTINANDVPETATETFNYMMSDFDGDQSSAKLKITLTGNDDQPTIAEKYHPVDESDLSANNPLVYTSTIPHDFGDDGAGMIMPTGVFDASHDVGQYTELDTVYSGGEPVIVTVEGNGYVGKLADGTTVFSLDINGQTGEFTYKQFEALDHYDPNDADDVMWLKFRVKITDADGDVDEGIIGIDVHDDGPFIPAKFHPVDETDLKDGVLEYSSAFPHDFGTDGAGMVMPTGTFEARYSQNGAIVTQPTSQGQPVTVTQTANGYIGKLASGLVVFTLDINPANASFTYKQYEALDHPDANDPDDIIWLKFHVKIVDADGDTSYGIIGIDVHDDGPVAHTDVNVFDGMMTDGNVLAGANGGDNSSDYLSQDDPTLVTKISFDGADKAVGQGFTTIDGKFGTLQIDQNGDYKYVLNDQPPAEEKQTLYSFDIDNPPGSDAGGDIKNVNVEYNETIGKMTFTMVIDDDAEGFTVAINDGPNPKGINNELALFYFDASKGGTPIVTAYNYNGQNTQTSWTGNEISSSLNANSMFSGIAVTEANGVKTMTFMVDVDAIDNFYSNPEWTGASFDDQIGIWLHPSKDINTSYDHNGFLTKWDTNGTGYYDSAYQDAEVTQICPCGSMFDPNQSDVPYGVNSVTLDGITVSVGNPLYNNLSKGVLNWVNTSDVGSGIGIAGNGSNKVWQPGENLEARFDEAAQKVTIEIADIGANNIDDGIDFKVYVEGQPSPVSYEFDIRTVTPEDGMITIELDANDFGGLITGFDVFSISNSHLGTTSFLLHSIHTECPPEVVAGTDIFEYMITDYDGDSSTAHLVFNSGDGEAVNGTIASETLQGTALDDVIFGAGGDDVLFGGAGADTFLFLSDDGTSTIHDFDVSEGDSIDISQLLEQYDPVTDAINDFVFTTTSGGDTTIAVDASGSGNVANATDIVTLEGVTVDLDALLSQQSLVS